MIIFIPLGIIASIFQLVILREFNFSIAKNELAFVVATGLWIVSCSLGSITKTPKKLRELPFSTLSSLAFSLSICLIHLAKTSIGLKYYEEASPNKDVKLRAGTLPKSRTCASGKLPSVALDSGIHAGMTEIEP